MASVTVSALRFFVGALVVVTGLWADQWDARDFNAAYPCPDNEEHHVYDYNRVKTICNGYDAVLTCPENSCINVREAFWGYYNRSVCPYPSKPLEVKCVTDKPELPGTNKIRSTRKVCAWENHNGHNESALGGRQCYLLASHHWYADIGCPKPNLKITYNCLYPVIP